MSNQNKPSPEQLAKQLRSFALEQYKAGELQPAYGYFDDLHQCQADEISVLKAQAAELMPLAKFAALEIEATKNEMRPTSLYRAILSGVYIGNDNGGCKLQPSVAITIQQMIIPKAPHGT